MAIFHFSGQVFSRSKGVSSVAKAAYRSASYLVDERTGLEYDYTKRREEIQTEIFAPDNAPEWVYNRSKLWNAVEAKEKRNDAQVAREINIALPKELTKEQQKELTREYVKETFVSKGMVADVSYHFNQNNPHIHVMLTMRDINQDGFQNKNRSWNDKELMEVWRESWAQGTNKHLEKAKISERIDHRSFERQGVNKLPTMHLGVKYHHMERKGIETRVGELNRQVKEFNRQKIVELDHYKKLRQELLETEKLLAPKRYTIKNQEFKVKMQVYNSYKNEFPAARYFKYTHSKALFNMNSNYGKTITIKSIIQAYNMLLKFKELEIRIVQELSKLQQANTIIKEINQRKFERNELMRNPVSKIANKSKIATFDKEIEQLENRLYSTGIREENFTQMKSSIEQSKGQIDSKVKEFNLAEKAKEAIDFAQAKYDKSVAIRKSKQRNVDRNNNDGRRRKGR